MTPNKSNSGNPFADFNPFANLDLGKFDFSAMLGDLKVPGFDVEGLVASQRKNVEALTAANQIAVKGMQDIAKRQTELMSQAMGEVSEVVQEVASKASNPQEMATKQAQLTKELFEKSIANLREMADMVSKSNTDAMEVINKRIGESMEELKKVMPSK